MSVSAGDGATELVAGAEHAGRRLDDVLAEALGVGRRTAVRLVERTRVNGRRASKGERLRAGDRVVVQAAPGPAASETSLEVVLDGEDVLVVAKPAGLPTVALRGAAGDSLAARIAARFPECAAIGQPGESGLVHRLDTGTSGLLLVARTAEAYANLRAQFREHRVEKQYLALVAGRLTDEVRIATPIGQHRRSRTRMRTVAPGMPSERYTPRPATTDVVPLRVFADATLVRATTCSGVRHQIRVHLASIGHPLVNDTTYGGPTLAALPGFVLHASALRWHDVRTGSERWLELPLPATVESALAQLEPDVRDARRADPRPHGAR
ncbi:MAG TPA: RluA family pseudouridine synthase [Candidatus Binatia bacterium]